MGFPRSRYVKDGEEGLYHCVSRCVRRAFLCGSDAFTGRDFSHRKPLIVDRLRYLATIFAIEVCAYAIMENHYHSILRTRPDIVATWPDREVAIRWLTLFPKRLPQNASPSTPTEEQIRALLDQPQRIVELRKRLSSLSWFMGRLNEHIARVANKEDDVKGRFWEGRFKCRALLDDAAIAAGMVYVDLNSIRAGLARTPEGSDFTSIQERIHVRQKQFRSPSPAPDNHTSTTDALPDSSSPSVSWLCPISSDSQPRGILAMTEIEYFDLVDSSGRMIRSDKPGAIDADLAPILQRIGANTDAWMDTISRFERKFCLAAGLVSHMRLFADHIGCRWLKGLKAARAAFAASPS